MEDVSNLARSTKHEILIDVSRQAFLLIGKELFYDVDDAVWNPVVWHVRGMTPLLEMVGEACEH